MTAVITVAIMKRN